MCDLFQYLAEVLGTDLDVVNATRSHHMHRVLFCRVQYKRSGDATTCTSETC